MYSTRHVVFQVGAVLFTVLGLSAVVSALLRSLLPRIDWSWPRPASLQLLELVSNAVCW